LRNGVAVSGATSTTYQLTSADLGAFMSFAITGTLAGYTTKTSTVNSGTAVMEGAISPAPTPTIVGSNRVGQVLTASPGTWMSGATLTYQWLRGGTAISGATSASYTVLESDAGANISVAVRGSATAYASSTVTSTALKILTPPKLPTISSTFAKTTRFDVYWTWEANTTYGFTAKNASGTVVGQYTCSTTCVSPFWIESLPSNSAAVNYTLEYFATTDGGTVTGSTVASTYPKLNLNVNMISTVRTGNQYVYSFDVVPGWTYQFSSYKVYGTSSCPTFKSEVVTSSPITVWNNTIWCNTDIIVSDQRGNVSAVAVSGHTTASAPAPNLTGSLSANSATTATTVSYSATYSSFYNYSSFNMVILNAGGTAVTPAVSPTASRTGGVQSGSVIGTIYFTGLAAGTYTIRMDFRNTSGQNAVQQQTASIVLGTVTVTAG
jgi:hypothetical protein